MSERKSFSARWIFGNPLYVLSAAVMMYGIALVLDRHGPSPGDLPHIFTAYAALQLYEAALIGLAGWILLRLLVPEDGHTLLLLECLFLGGAFIALDELLAADITLGFAVCGIGLTLAAVKLGLARRATGLPIGRASRMLSLGLMALPVAWVPWMQSVVDDPVSAAGAAFAAWASLAVMLFAALLFATRRVRSLHRSSAAVSLVLVIVTLLTAGCHLFSLHHAFLAPTEFWYPVPVLAVLGGYALWSAFTLLPRHPWRDFGVLWLPLAPMLLFYLDPSFQRAPWRELPPLLQPLLLARWWIVVVYASLLISTRRTWLALPLATACVLAAGPRRDALAEFASDYRGWCFVVLAFALLVLGAGLTAYKHRRRLPITASPGAMIS